MKELLITGAWRCGEQQVQALEQMRYAVTFWPDERQAVNMDTQRFEAVICGGLFLTTPIERFPALKCLQVTYLLASAFHQSITHGQSHY